MFDFVLNPVAFPILKQNHKVATGKLLLCHCLFAKISLMPPLHSGETHSRAISCPGHVNISPRPEIHFPSKSAPEVASGLLSGWSGRSGLRLNDKIRNTLNRKLLSKFCTEQGEQGVIRHRKLTKTLISACNTRFRRMLSAYIVDLYVFPSLTRILNPRPELKADRGPQRFILRFGPQWQRFCFPPCFGGLEWKLKTKSDF